MRAIKLGVFFGLGIVAGAAPAQSQEHTIRVALTRSIVSGTTLVAIEKGFFNQS